MQSSVERFNGNGGRKSWSDFLQHFVRHQAPLKLPEPPKIKEQQIEIGNRGMKLAASVKDALERGGTASIPKEYERVVRRNLQGLGLSETQLKNLKIL